MSDYRATIGLEIHAELKTRTKMFCACLNDPDEKEPNKNICPVCMAHPGYVAGHQQRSGAQSVAGGHGARLNARARLFRV